MILINDGEFIAGTLWKVGYEPTGENSVKNKGGLWLNEVGMEDTKEETTMIDLSKAEIGDEFTTCASVVTLVLKGSHHHCLEYPDGSLMLSNNSGLTVDSGSNLTSKHEPRHWLKDLPDAGLFRGEFLAMDKNNSWYSPSSDVDIYESYWRGNGTHYLVSGIKMPILTGDEWKKSKISIADLREWQDEYINV